MESLDKTDTFFDTGVTSPQAAKVLRAVVTGKTGLLVFKKLLSISNDPVVKTFHCGVALLSSGLLIDLSRNKEIGRVKSRECEVVKTEEGFLISDWDGQKPIFDYVSKNGLERVSLMLNISSRKFLSYENRLFAVTEQGLTELVVNVFSKPILSTRQTWGVMVNSTKWFNGVGIQDTMGAIYLIAPFGNEYCGQVRVRELDSLKVIQAKSGNRYVSLVVVAKDGSYRIVELTFDSDYKTYKVTEVPIDSPEQNLAILPKGVCARIVKDGELEILVPTKGVINRIEDSNLGTDVVISNWRDQVVYIHDGDLWSMSMK